MLRSSGSKWIIGVIVFIAVLSVLRFKPWQRGHSTTREQLAVGFLPVT